MNSTGAFTAFHVTRIVLTYLGGFTVVSLLLFLWRSDDWLVFFVALTLLTFGGGRTFIGIGPVPSMIVNAGNVLVMLLLFTFPNGVFVPAWTRKFLWVLLLWTIASLSIDFFREQIPQLPRVMGLGHLVWQIFWGVGVWAQIYRFRYVSNQTERQQVKWVVVALPILFLLGVGSLLLYDFYSASPNSPITVKVVAWVLDILTDVTALLLAIGIGLAVYGYKVWEADFYLVRTLVFSMVTGVLAGLWWFAAILVQLFINNFAKQETSPIMVALISGIPAATLFQPLRENTRKWASTRLYKDQIDFTKVIVELQPENWQFVSLHDMAQAVMKNTARLLEINKAAIYAFDGETMQLMDSIGIAPDQANQLNEMNISELQKGKVIQLGKENPFTMRVPLVVLRGHTNDLIGLLALGPRAQDRGYSRDHINNLKNLGQRAGMAIHFLQLNEKKKAS